MSYPRQEVQTSDLIAELERDNSLRCQREHVFENDLARRAFRATSPDGAIEVTVAWDGVLTGLSLHKSAAESDARAVAERIAQTYAVAQQRAASEVGNVIGDARIPRKFLAQRLDERRTLEPSVVDGGSTQQHPESGATTPESRSDDSYDDDDYFDADFLKG